MSDQDEIERMRYLQLKAKASAGGQSQQTADGGYNYTPLQKTANKISGAMGAFDRALTPPGVRDNPNYTELGFGSTSDDLFNKMGEGVTDFLGRHIDNPVVPALAGTLVSIGNPANWLAPEGAQVKGKFAAPEVPPGRVPGVNAAREINMPLRRGEVTGGRVANSVSNMMEKTVMGSGPEDAFTKSQYAALDAEKQRLTTPTDPYVAGQKAQTSQVKRQLAMRTKKDAMFDAVPDDVHIPLTEYGKHGGDVISKQSKVRPLARNPEVTKFAEDAQTPYLSTGEGVTGGPEVHGVTTQSPETVIPGKTIITEHTKEVPPNQPYKRGPDGDIYQEGGDASHYTANQIPERRIPGHDQYEASYSVEPEQKFAPKSNYHDVKELRETLNAKIKEAEKAGNDKAYREFTQMKEALDTDIENFANSEISPLDSMMAKEFKKNFRKANAYSGAYKGLFKSDEAKALLNADPNKVGDMVFKGKNNETAIKRFRALVGEDGFLPAKQKFTQDLLESNNVSKELAKYEDGHLRAIYSGPELAELRRYGLAQEMPKTSNLQGTQGSARSNVHAVQYTGLGAGLWSLLHGNVPAAVAGVGQFLAPAAISRLNLATRGGIPYSLGRGTITGAAGALGAAKQKAYSDFLEKGRKK